MKRLCTIDFDFREEAPIEIDIDAVSVITVGGGDTDEYEGEYTIVPKLAAQTLLTKDRVLRKDIPVEEIPITVTANTAGGNTIIIGG